MVFLQWKVIVEQEKTEGNIWKQKATPTAIRWYDHVVDLHGQLQSSSADGAPTCRAAVEPNVGSQRLPCILEAGSPISLAVCSNNDMDRNQLQNSYTYFVE